MASPSGGAFYGDIMEVQAIANFEHNGKKKFGDSFTCSDSVAKGLISKKLVEVKVTPKKEAIGKKSSASPVAQVSPKKTVKKSKSGGRKKKAAE